MRFFSLFRLSLLSVVIFSFFSCKKKIEIFQTDALSDYMPLSAGKYITYRVDSTVFTNFGRNVEIHSYQVKHLIESQITDNLGRPGYRVFRYMRDTAGIQSWQAAGAYFITPLSNQIELIEDNLRFIKMHLPIKEGFSWKGNKFLSADPYESLYPFTNDDDMEDWDYNYESTNDIFSYKQQTLAGVVKIVQIDERFALDTVNVLNNKVTIPKNSDATYVRGSASDTIIINASDPESGHEKLTVYNRTNFFASLNKIIIPPGFALYFEFRNNKWYYPNPLTVLNNKITIPRNISLAYIFGNATDSIKIDVSNLDTFQTKKLTIYNKSNSAAYLNYIGIPPGFGRNYELRNGQWTFADNINVLLNQDPFNSDLPFGSTNYSIEKYAKNIGLVYKELIMWDYQPGGAYKTGFGILMRMIDHN